MKKISKKLFGWSNAFVFVAVIEIVISFIGFIMDSAWSGNFFNAAIILFILSPYTRGFATLVQNAEEEMAHRFDVKLEKSDDEK